MKKVLHFLILLWVSTIVANAQITLPYFESFEDAPTFLSDGWGLWYDSSDTSNLGGFGFNNNYAYHGTQSLQFSSYNLLSDDMYDQYLVTPKITAANNIKISFYYKDTPHSPESFRIGYSSDASFSGDFSTFTWTNNTTTAGDSAWTYYEKIVPAGTTYIAIDYRSNYLYYLYIDYVNITETTLAPSVLTESVDLGVGVYDNSFTSVLFNDTVLYGNDLDISLGWYNYNTSPSDFNDLLYFAFYINGNYYDYAYGDYSISPLAIGANSSYTITSLFPYDSIVAWGLIGQTAQVCVDLVMGGNWTDVDLSDNTYCYDVYFADLSVDLGIWVIDDYDYDVLADTVSYGNDLDIYTDSYIYVQNAIGNGFAYADTLIFDLTVDGVYMPGYLGYIDYTNYPLDDGTWELYNVQGLIPYDSIVAWGLLGRTVQVCLGITLNTGWNDIDLSDNTYCYNVTFEGPTVVNTFTLTATAGVGGTISPAGSTTVQQGSSQTYTITPSSCYTINDVLVDGVSQGAINSYTFTNVQANGTISVSFTQQTYTVTVTVGANGTASYGTYTFAAGSTQTITLNCGDQPTFNFYPAAGYQINDVLANGSSVGSVASYQFPAINSNSTIDVSFSQIPAGTFIVSASAGVGGTISPNGTTNYNAGDNATYTISADNCYTINDVTVDGVSQGAINSYTFNNIQSNSTITASFQITTYNVTVSASAGGSVTYGTYTVAAGQTLTIPVNCGDEPVFTFYPDNGYQIGSVVVNGSNVGTSTTYQMSPVSADATLNVSFTATAANTYTITATADNGGTISPSGTSTYNEGDYVTYLITPADCYTISDVLVDGTSIGAASSHIFTNISANHSIYAVFAPTTYTITVTVSNGGSVIYNGTTIPEGTTQQITVECGADASFTFVPNTNCSVKDVTVNGSSVGNVTTYTFTGVSSDGTLVVEFKEGVSVSEYAASFNLWPSPATDFLNIEFEQAASTKVSLLNLLGEVIGEWYFTEPAAQINLSGVSSGVYFVRVSSQSGTLTRKFVKE